MDENKLIAVYNRRFDVRTEEGIQRFLAEVRDTTGNLVQHISTDNYRQGSYGLIVTPKKSEFHWYNLRDVLRGNPEHIRGAAKCCEQFLNDCQLIAELKRMNLAQDYSRLLKFVEEGLEGFFEIPKKTEQRKVSIEYFTVISERIELAKAPAWFFSAQLDVE